jgi:hypothetical protein
VGSSAVPFDTLGIIVVQVSVADVRVEHEAKVADFTKWLEKTGESSPRELTQRQRIRSILYAGRTIR